MSEDEPGYRSSFKELLKLVFNKSLDIEDEDVIEEEVWPLKNLYEERKYKEKEKD